MTVASALGMLFRWRFAPLAASAGGWRQYATGGLPQMLGPQETEENCWAVAEPAAVPPEEAAAGSAGAAPEAGGWAVAEPAAGAAAGTAAPAKPAEGEAAARPAFRMRSSSRWRARMSWL
jgi:hypothetical protein